MTSCSGDTSGLKTTQPILEVKVDEWTYQQICGGRDHNGSLSLTRGLYLELLPNLTTEEFIRSLKRLVARQGRRKKIYSDNGKTFVAASKWLKQVEREETVHNWLATHGIKWQFNLSRAPWWGGQFERLVGLVKQSLYKTIGNGNLLRNELQEVILDNEIALNNRPLSYVEEDVQFPMLTPNVLLFGQPNLLPEMDPDQMEEADLRKRAKYLLRCKEVFWSRWTREYVKALRKRHNLIHKTKCKKKRGFYGTERPATLGNLLKTEYYRTARMKKTLPK